MGLRRSVGEEDRRAVLQLFDDLFFKEARQRASRQDFDQETMECEWEVLERKAMLDLVNKKRAERGKSSLSEDRYKRLETTCSGHSDYAKKLCLGSMELVFDEE